MSDIKTTFTIFCYSFLFFRFCDFFFIIVIPCLFPNFCLYFPYICNVYFTLRIIIYLISLFSVYIYSVFISVLVYSLFSCVYFLLYFYSGVLSSPECSRHDILSDYRKSLLHHALGLCSWTIDSLSLCLISFFSSAFCLLYVLLTFHPLFWRLIQSSSSSSFFLLRRLLLTSASSSPSFPPSSSSVSTPVSLLSSLSSYSSASSSKRKQLKF